MMLAAICTVQSAALEVRPTLIHSVHCAAAWCPAMRSCCHTSISTAGLEPAVQLLWRLLYRQPQLRYRA